MTGGAVATVGGVLFLEGRLSASSADERCGSRGACVEVDGLVDGERARSRAEVGGWVAGTGRLTAAGGLVWHVLSRPIRPMDQGGPPTGLAWVHVPSGGGLGWSELLILAAPSDIRTMRRRGCARGAPSKLGLGR